MTVITKELGNRQLPFDRERLANYIKRVTNIDSSSYNEKVFRSIESHEEYKAESITSLLINTALENVDEANTQWTYDAAKIYLDSLYKKASRNRSYDKEEKYGDFFGLIKVLAGKGIYSPNILEKYSREEIKQLAKIIDPDKDLLFDYTGLHLLTDRYLAKDFNKEIYELPQERWLVIAMYLMQDEDKTKRSELVKEAYWALSNLYMTVATPTLANAGLNHGQLSSCFIDTVEDSLQGIYDSNTDVAKLSKDGGGIGEAA
ncbi:ribonucleotide reductase N-terminal alpha domain-containing protein [Siminovitchia fordii]|uniref:Ribonucleoside-diphosphate reductase n=1 Tax=Siminovitchia fordii TaxID=254759 RepID=A0ABQ4KA78_9BACI|nr:ribonucleotide reductase N-terminal alpha domain-containing protein [Siminovitchia fordii]GIN22511.1 hypothetical protein J1TS3_36450 [Siminovitchia fordii]